MHIFCKLETHFKNALLATQTINEFTQIQTHTNKYANTDKLKFIYISNVNVLSCEINFPFSNSPDFKEHFKKLWFHD